MHEVLNRNTFFVKEHVGLFKAANNYDILDPETGETIMLCREDIGSITKLFRWTDYKRMTPFNINITTPDGEKVVNVNKGVSFFRASVNVKDENGNPLGGFKQKFFSIGGKFDVLNNNGQPVCSLKGKWTSWEFKFIRGNEELATVTKKWMGAGKELFTSADNYILQINDNVPQDSPLRQLIMAAVMCIDMVLKE